MATFCADCGKNITLEPSSGPSHECKQQRAANRAVAATRITLVCNECGKVWLVSPNAADPQCARCNSVDYEVRS